MIKFRPIPINFSGFSPVYLIATWFQSGRIRPASGTWGTIAAFPFCWLVMANSGRMGLLVFTILVAVFGLWAVRNYVTQTSQPDPSEVVIDEVLGMAICGLLMPFSFGWWVFGFFLFRFFDMFKRGLVGWCDRNIKGALGVMVDDVVAGVMAGAIILLLSMLFA